MELALGLDRLPLTRAALAAGLIDERRAEVIAEELAGLDDEHAAAVEKLIIGKAPGLTSGQLRALARRAVLSADPEAARKRKEKALQDARVETFPETAGTAALSGRDLPPASVLAADKHLTALAQALQAAGTPGTLDTLRARAYLHLLTGQPAATLILQTTHPGRPGRRHPRPSTRDPSTPAPAAPPPAPPGASTGSTSRPPRPPVPSGSRSGGLPGLRGTVNLTMPLTAWLGWTQSPGDVPGYGPLDAGDSRTLADLLAHRPRQPVVRHPHRPRRAPRRPRLRPPRPPRPTPAAGYAPRTTQPQGPAGPWGLAEPGRPAEPRRPAGPGPTGPSPPGGGPDPRAPVPDWLRGLTFTTLQGADCTHDRQSRGYQPSRTLRHLIQVRNPTCTGPGCRRPATRCDLDHVTPYDQGGRTCECNLHPACRHDHHTKQVPGWTVTCHQPGTVTWTTPGNRSHTASPAEYWE